jgi:hypothetical protein
MTAGIDRQARTLLTKASEDEVVLRLNGVPEGPFGFHVQQAIEKLFKALLCQLEVEYKYTHDLNELVVLLKSAGENPPDALIDFSRIGAFAVAHRYDDIPEFYVLDRAAAIHAVHEIREYVLARIAALSTAP